MQAQVGAVLDQPTGFRQMGVDLAAGSLFW